MLCSDTERRQPSGGGTLAHDDDFLARTAKPHWGIDQQPNTCDAQLPSHTQDVTSHNQLAPGRETVQKLVVTDRNPFPKIPS